MTYKKHVTEDNGKKCAQQNLYIFTERYILYSHDKETFLKLGMENEKTHYLKMCKRNKKKTRDHCLLHSFKISYEFSE